MMMDPSSPRGLAGIVVLGILAANALVLSVFLHWWYQGIRDHYDDGQTPEVGVWAIFRFSLFLWGLNAVALGTQAWALAHAWRWI